MFDGGLMTLDRDAEVESLGPREVDWKALHQRLRGIAKRRVALEAEEASYLVEAEETQLYRRLGYTTMIEYMERELYWGPHAAKERLRVARELEALPLISELFHEGELCFSAVRELTRVATPATEEAFLHKAQGKTAHHIQEMVAGLKLHAGANEHGWFSGRSCLRDSRHDRSQRCAARSAGVVVSVLRDVDAVARQLHRAAASRGVGTDYPVNTRRCIDAVVVRLATTRAPGERDHDEHRDAHWRNCSAHSRTDLGGQVAYTKSVTRSGTARGVDGWRLAG